MFDHLKDHTSKLFGTWILGTATWIAEAHTIIGLLGATLGLFAGLMLVVIRWDDFVDSTVMRRLRGLPKKPKSLD